MALKKRSKAAQAKLKKQVAKKVNKVRKVISVGGIKGIRSKELARTARRLKRAASKRLKFTGSRVANAMGRAGDAAKRKSNRLKKRGK